MAKRNASDSSNISDHSSLSNKKFHLQPLVSKDEELPVNIPDLAKFLSVKLNDLHQSVNDSLEMVWNKVDDAVSKNTVLETKVNTMETKMQTLTNENVKLKKDLGDLKEACVNMEIQQRKNNGLFSGITELVDEKPEQCKAELLKSLSRIPGNDKFTIGRCHRIGTVIPGKPRDIIVHFPNENDKSVIIENRKLLPQNVYINEDLPYETLQRKRELLPIFRLAKSMDKFKSVKLKQDKLLIGRTTYTVDNLDKLPPELNPINTCVKEDESTYVYFGKKHPLSNFYPAVTKIDGKSYPTTEHFIQEQKAILFNQPLLASQIASADSPSQCKTMSKNISGYNHQQWCNHFPTLIEKALKNKVAQNPIVLQSLLNTGAKRLGEATFDKPWGTGLGLRDVNTLNVTLWNGSNVMGNTLEKIRDEFKT